MTGYRTLLSIPLLTFCLVTAGCQESISEPERQHIATAYAELLITKNAYNGDSTGLQHAIDSTLKQFGFAGEQEFTTVFDELSRQPDYLREVLDSTQNYLQNVQRGVEGTKMNTSP